MSIIQFHIFSDSIIDVCKMIICSDRFKKLLELLFGTQDSNSVYSS